MVFRAREKYFETGEKPLIMGILNVTPDSFSDGGKYFNSEVAVSRALSMIEEGADIIDVGGESTRPGSRRISPEEEAARIVPVIEEIKSRADVCVSADTYKNSVAIAALEAGADMINCVNGTDPGEEIFRTAASFSAGLCLMHMKGEPETMQNDTDYNDIVRDVTEALSVSMDKAVRTGVHPDYIVLDPGIGFGKSTEGNLMLIRNIVALKKAGRPILIGLSRKSFLGYILDAGTDQRLYGTVAANTAAYILGAEIFRVHDVKANAEALKTAKEIMRQKVTAQVK